MEDRETFTRSLKRFYFIWHAAFSDRLFELGLTPIMYDVLTILRQHGCLPACGIAKLCMVKPQVLTEVLRRLDKSGLISYDLLPKSGNRTNFRLNHQGARLISLCDGVRDSMETETFGKIPWMNRRRFRWYLDELATA
ncbi:unnamed protein product, partial [Phaeothamnion confervicola]